MVKLTPELIVRSTSCSGKRGRDESVLRFFKRITHLYLEEKGLSEVEGDVLVPCSNLTVLYLYDNKLTCIPNIQRNQNLTQLFLQNNSITHIEHLNELNKLTKLYLGGNSIATVEGLSSLNQLQELHIENQKLSPGEKLTLDPRSIHAIGASLAILNISGNGLDSLVDLKPLSHLTELSACSNRLTDLTITTDIIGGLRFLCSLNLTGNPICSCVKYRDRLILCAPRMAKLDGKEVTELARKFLQNWRTQRETVENQKKSLIRQKSEIMSATGQRNEIAWPRGDGGEDLNDPDYPDMMKSTLNAYDGLIGGSQPKRTTTKIQGSFSLPALPPRIMYKVLPCSSTQHRRLGRSAEPSALHQTQSVDNNYLHSHVSLVSNGYNRNDIPMNGLRIL